MQNWMFMASLWLAAPFSLAAPNAHGTLPIDSGTRIAEVMNAPALDGFAQGFARLSDAEQRELVTLLSTDMLGWEGLAHLPPQPGELVSPDRQRSIESLAAWLAEAPDAEQPLSGLRFVSVHARPPVKLKFEKGACLPERLDFVDRFYLKAYRQALTWWSRLSRRPASMAATDTARACRREISVSLAAESSLQGLREQAVIRVESTQLLTYLQGANWPQFRRKAWEGLEILLSDLRGDESQVPQRLRVIEITQVTHEAFLLRRQMALRLRSRTPSVQGR